MSNVYIIRIYIFFSKGLLKVQKPTFYGDGKKPSTSFNKYHIFFFCGNKRIEILFCSINVHDNNSFFFFVYVPNMHIQIILNK